MKTLQNDPRAVPLGDALETLGKIAHGLTAAAEPETDEVPGWLQHALVGVVGMPQVEVGRLTPEQAQAVWDAFVGAPKGRPDSPD